MGDAPRVGVRSRALLLGLVVATAAGCPAANEPPNLAGGPSPEREPALFRTVLSALTRGDNLPVEGEWGHQFGDANFYGAGFFLRYGHDGGNPLQTALGARTNARNAALVEKAGGSASLLLQELDYVMMSCLGLAEGYRLDPDEGLRESLDKMVDIIDEMGALVSYFPEQSGGDGAASTYGPSAINASLALLNLEVAESVGGPRRADRIKTAEAILAKADELGYLPSLGYYRFDLDDTSLALYPNVTQMAARLRAYRLTGEAAYLERAEALYRAIQPLKVAGEGRYRSPYSAKAMGAKTSDYTTLSSQNYTMIALALLSRETGDEAYLEEASEILAFIRDRLLGEDGLVLHHWMDGRAALPTDPVYYCTGCNLQLLYILWRLEDRFAS